MKKIKLLILCFSMLFITACASKQKVEPIKESIVIKDLVTYPQSVDYFAKKQTNTVLASSLEIQENITKFRRLYFRAWHVKRASIKAADVRIPFERENKGYSENLKPWDLADWQKITSNADLTTFPNSALQAITIKESDVRQMPTMRPRFLDTKKSGSAYPFDMMQYASIPVGFPLFVIHQSQDKAWVYVETAYICGWIRSDSIAYVDNDFIQKWEKSQLVTFTKEDIPLVVNAKMLAHGEIGALLPASSTRIYLPVSSDGNNAVFTSVPKPQVGVENFPMKFTPQNIAKLGDELMGQPYGWGGYLSNRDCSEFLRDIFAAFGIWLPRNSSQQIKVGEVVELGEISNSEKIDLILENAKPFASLIYLPGHIGLYIGEHKGNVAFLHDIWGIRTIDDGRIVIGKVAITSLEPAKEQPKVDKEKTILNRVSKYNNLILQ